MRSRSEERARAQQAKTSQTKAKVRSDRSQGVPSDRSTRGRESGARGPKYVLGYARVSTTEQRDEGVSIAAQRARIKAYAQAHGYHLVSVIEDVASGAVAPDRRPGLRQALEAVRGGLADGLVVVRFDRLGRRTMDVLQLAAEAERRGWQLVSINEHLDTGTAIGGLVMTILAALAEMERRQISERTIVGMRQVALEGRARSFHLPFGYRVEGEAELATLRKGERRPLVEHAPEQRALALLLRLRDRGLGGHAIATRLNNAGKLNPRTSARWTASGVRRVLATARERCDLPTPTRPRAPR